MGFGGRYVPVGRCSAADRAGRRDQTPRPSGVARGPGARWAPFRTGLRCHFGRCWASATGRQHPRRQPRPEATAFPYSQKEGTYVPFLGCHRARASPYRPTGACGRCPALFSPAAPVKAVERCSTPRKPLKRLERNFYAASRGDSLKNCLYQIKKAYTVHTRRLLSALPFLWSSSSFISFSVWKNFWAFSPKNSSLTML